MVNQEQLCAAALAAAHNAYAPYSRFRVGAALLCADGSIVTGVNVENRSFGLTICAERSAVVAAVSAGKQAFLAIAIAGIDANYPLPPCGACRQVLSEFLPKDAPVYFCSKDAEVVKKSMGDLMPFDSLHELSEGHL